MKKLALLLALLLAVISCATMPAMAEAEEPIVLTVGKEMDAAGIVLPEGHDVEKNNYWLQYIEETRNIKIEYEWLIADQEQKVSLALASGDMPDVMVVNYNDFMMLQESDMLADLTDAFNATIPGSILETSASLYPLAYEMACNSEGRLIADVRGACTQRLLHDLLVERLTVGTGNLLTHRQQALIHAAAFSEALLRDRPPVVHKHDVHGSVAYIGDHVLPPELMELIGHGSKALRKNVRASEAHAVFLTVESKTDTVISQKVLPECFLLAAQPSQRQTRGDEHSSVHHMPEIQFASDGGQREQVVIVVVHLVRAVFLVALADGKEVTAILQHMTCQLGPGFIVIHARAKAAAGGLDVAVAVVDA